MIVPFISLKNLTPFDNGGPIEAQATVSHEVTVETLQGNNNVIPQEGNNAVSNPLESNNMPQQGIIAAEEGESSKVLPPIKEILRNAADLPPVVNLSSEEDEIDDYYDDVSCASDGEASRRRASQKRQKRKGKNCFYLILE